MKLIRLSQGKEAVVDDKDFEFLNKNKWYCWSFGGMLYAARTIEVFGKSKSILMHRVICNSPKGSITDHIDGNGLNNQRSNLRVASSRVNQRNQSRHRASPTALGTTHHKSGKYQAQARGKYLGLFDTEQEAHTAFKRYDACFKK